MNFNQLKVEGIEKIFFSKRILQKLSSTSNSAKIPGDRRQFHFSRKKEKIEEMKRKTKHFKFFIKIKKARRKKEDDIETLLYS